MCPRVRAMPTRESMYWRHDMAYYRLFEDVLALQSYVGRDTDRDEAAERDRQADLTPIRDESWPGQSPRTPPAHAHTPRLAPAVIATGLLLSLALVPLTQHAPRTRPAVDDMLCPVTYIHPLTSPPKAAPLMPPPRRCPGPVR